MKNKSIKKLISLGALVLFVLATQSASAYVPGVWDPQPRRLSNEPAFTTVPISNEIKTTSNADTHDHGHNTSNSNTNTTRNTSVSSNTNQPTTRTVASSNNVRTNTIQTRNVAPTQNTFNVVDSQSGINGGIYPNPNNSENNLTALSLRGSGGFMPSSIWQWLLVVLLILVIIIIARMLGRKPEHHEVHTVTSH